MMTTKQTLYTEEEPETWLKDMEKDSRQKEIENFGQALFYFRERLFELNMPDFQCWKLCNSFQLIKKLLICINLVYF